MNNSVSGCLNENQTTQVLPATRKQRNLPRVLQPGHTVGQSPDLEEPLFSDASKAELQMIAWYGITDTGRVRENNEDNFAILELADKFLFVVADGMGGHDAGEVASKIAIESVCKLVREEHSGTTAYLNLVERAVQEANSQVLQEGVRRGANIGTTLSVALVVDGIAYIGSVGDSRIYWIGNESLSQITTDHSLVAKLVAAGKLTKEECRNHPQANFLIRTIGTDKTVKVDTFRVPLKKNDTLLLCTDGLWGEVSEEEIQWVCTREQDVVDVGDWLVDLAKENGGRDNVTVIAVKVF